MGRKALPQGWEEETEAVLAALVGPLPSEAQTHPPSLHCQLSPTLVSPTGLQTCSQPPPAGL